MADKTIVNSGFKTWNPDQLPNLKGKTYLITGGNAGLGFETAKHLGKAGADIILACRSLEKAEKARQQLISHVNGLVEVVQLDLSDLNSVHKAAGEIHQKYEKLDGLINNAGLMQTPQQKTAQGFEMQVGTNHLGHFLLTGLLLDLIEKAAGRVVVLSSLAHKFGTLNLDDYMSEKNYSPTGAYINSKNSNLMFAFELDRKLKEAGSKVICIAAHPGYSNTNLQSTGPKGLFNWIYKLTNPLFAQAADQGALPAVLAAAGLEAKRGAYYGPQKMNEYRGPVGDAKVAAHALDKSLWKKLWALSEDLVGYRWRFPAKTL
ncbi:oxidoreductase [Agarilytica rhodophyticola]|uniref:oxidoreductase n=1 Tax=Agarilytica rhodophyticola TaxID=1737490 RepID=UPI000CD89B3D|nr:oxidoreductase [Agarilytica rhodophyticola]